MPTGKKHIYGTVMSNLHEGHRDRMRQKYIENGSRAFTDHELIEMLLYYAVPRKDTNELSHRLIKRFGSYSAIFNADINDLCEAGLSKNAAVFLNLVRDSGERYFTSTETKQRFLTVGDAAEFITKLLYSKKQEVLYIFLLNMKMELLGYEELSSGGISSVGLDSRTLLKTVLSYNAAYAILAHNHPTGTAAPSHADIKLTQTIIDLLKTIDVKLCDHIITSKNSFYSFNQAQGMSTESEKSPAFLHQYADTEK